ncbi:T-complex protein 1 subunit theta [Exophiala xenobiotica]|nr:T-complex protein 1 subunit theta [Exophiala xenobiotica]KAK5219302.1 T-complex protein 1 subunit theta [Exophiala xenobiotica]KAK5260427.1 T-complex protein 1 subunit theta [Exophiala xenobiotica]KAK5344633.1 T-complex protein 1 subunit theta [Exophiala xenobiotica]KAK5357253.1 T-complex protein 1 subunit theta [Exophiala xenobiotica]
MDFSKCEESQLESAIKELYDSGLRVVVAGSTVGELALHYLNRMCILVIKILSKFELRRLCRFCNATPLARLGAPMRDEMGSIDVIETTEIGGDRVTVFRQESDTATTRTATIVLRGATQNHLDDFERAIDDAVNVIKARISHFADKTPGLPQYAIRKYAEAFEVIPRTLAETAGLDATEVLARLSTAHQQRPNTSEVKRRKAKEESDESSSGEEEEDDEEEDDEEEDDEEGTSSSGTSEEEDPYWTTGVDLESLDSTGMLDAVDEQILDLLVTKSWAIRLATVAARTVLSVDQIIVARQAGGPKPPGQNPNWDKD